MCGEFIGVWSEAWREIWLPLIKLVGCVAEDTVGDPYRALAPSMFRTIASSTRHYRQSRNWQMARSV
jgi:hypothetical protein